MSRNKIVDAAVKLFSELGYHRTSMDDIAREANVAKGTLYYHFSGKGELFETIVTYGFQLLRDNIEQVLQADEAPDRQIRKIVHKHVELFLQYSELVHIISNELTNGIEPEILERINRIKQSYIDFLSGIIRQGYEDGALHKMNADLAAAGLIGMIESASMYAVKRTETYSAAELHDTINTLVLPALLK